MTHKNDKGPFPSENLNLYREIAYQGRRASIALVGAVCPPARSVHPLSVV